MVDVIAAPESVANHRRHSLLATEGTIVLIVLPAAASRALTSTLGQHRAVSKICKLRAWKADFDFGHWSTLSVVTLSF